MNDEDRAAAEALCAGLLDAIGPAILEHRTFIEEAFAAHRAGDTGRQGKIVVEIDNIKPHHALAIEDFLATWEQLGNLGGSRWTAFYSDGDGDFRPKITVNGKKAHRHGDPLEMDRRWTELREEQCYSVDPDAFTVQEAAMSGEERV